jgi:hypothetical protein
MPLRLAEIKSDRPHAMLTFFDYRTLAYRSMIAEFAVSRSTRHAQIQWRQTFPIW